jgi:hypothetical protein
MTENRLIAIDLVESLDSLRVVAASDMVPSSALVTKAMLDAGLSEYWEWDAGEDDLGAVLEAVFLAMLKAASVSRAEGAKSVESRVLTTGRYSTSDGKSFQVWGEVIDVQYQSGVPVLRTVK